MKKLERDMIARMAKASLRASRMRNGFVMLTIVLASALLMGILMFAVGQQEQTQRNLTHAQQVGYYNLTETQVEALQRDERIAYQIQVKTGVPTELDGFSVVPYYVSEMSDHRWAPSPRGASPRRPTRWPSKGPCWSGWACLPPWAPR